MYIVLERWLVHQSRFYELKMVYILESGKRSEPNRYVSGANSRLVPIQWETSLQNTTSYAHQNSHVWYHLECNVLENYTWQTGHEAVAFVSHNLGFVRLLYCTRCFVVTVGMWLGNGRFCPYLSGLLHRCHVTVKQPRKYEFEYHMNSLRTII